MTIPSWNLSKKGISNKIVVIGLAQDSKYHNSNRKTIKHLPFQASKSLILFQNLVFKQFPSNPYKFIENQTIKLFFFEALKSWKKACI